MIKSIEANSIYAVSKSIEAGTTYAKGEFLARTGLRQAAWLAAVRNGLVVTRVHGRVYVAGDAWLSYLANV